MQSDITPPENEQNKKSPKAQPMRSLRLLGHSVEDARKRLSDKEKSATTTKSSKEPEAEAVIALGDKHPGSKHPLHLLKHHLSKRSRVELAALALVLILGAGGVIYAFTHHPKKSVAPVVAKTVPTPPPPAPPPVTTVPSPLSGLQVAPALAQRPVTGIMIENSPDARPQSGLQDAGVVYEAIAEGGITRFLALFQDTTPQYIGPVRSVRPYYIDFATPYQAGIAHVGGSPEGLAEIRDGHHRDLDEFFSPSYFTRIASRPKPHNVYTDFNRLDKLNQSKGFTSSQYTPWPRKAEAPVASPSAAHIDVHISSQLYYSHYDYDKASNTYVRYEGGRLHQEISAAQDKSPAEITPKVVLALVMNYAVIDRAGHSSYVDTGSGQMFAFQDGAEVTGTWTKADQSSMFVFKDAAGQVLKLDAGQTWITIVGSPNNVKYTP